MAIKFAATFRDDVKLLNEAFRHFTIVYEVIMFVNSPDHYQKWIYDFLLSFDKLEITCTNATSKPRTAEDQKG